MKRIRDKRLEKGWTQFELAERSGVPQPTISQIERGNRKHPTHKNIMKIAKALEINLEELNEMPICPNCSITKVLKTHSYDGGDKN
ncbi:helix-turn-helix domain-containing protein [uncultured Metabacillus sp.]|uniref:helix-turn-helix domain-containing protein n=1 Tax=uncultured Metabacillus sp. TaxID=2860135 RepID=UPI00203F0442|nr:helix-turn-helix transcriptional regulator [Niallia sp. MER 6]MBY0155442.1 helix-turn-helix transcriptional regulator [Cytobacillus firmus]MCM3032538.1 helix-turn-helix domain-containing protein [Niallia sp. MER 6]